MLGPRHVLFAALAVACGGGAPGPEPVAAVDDGNEAAPPMPETVEWKAHPIAGAGVTIDVIDDVELRGGAIPGGGGFLEQRHEPMRLYVAWGRDVEADHRDTTLRITGAERQTSTVSVCGADARLVHTKIPGALEPGRGPADGNPVRVGEDPPRDRIELLLVAGEVPVRVLYEVDSRYRELHLGDEDRFLASIRCP